MDDCEACKNVEPIDAHFEAIFSFLEQHGLENNQLFADLALNRIAIHSIMRAKHDNR